jgi:Uma2 family endonuclease
MTGFSEEPRAPYSARMDKVAFLRWNADREGTRCELKDGEIVMHPGVSRNHARVAMSFIRALDKRLDDKTWSITAGDFAVEIGEDIRYPDVLIEPVGGDGLAYTTLQPALLVEVLSPSSAGRDLRLKVEEYTSLPSLEAYIVASPDEPIDWIWQRDAMSREFPAEPVEIKGLAAAIEIAALSVTLPLAEIYRGITGA